MYPLSKGTLTLFGLHRVRSFLSTERLFKIAITGKRIVFKAKNKGFLHTDLELLDHEKIKNSSFSPYDLDYFSGSRMSVTCPSLGKQSELKIAYIIELLDTFQFFFWGGGGDNI